MRAAVINAKNDDPVVTDFDAPTASGSAVVADVVVGGMNPVDLLTAAGAEGNLDTPYVAGTEGIASVAGERRYFSAAVGRHGFFAEQTLVDPGAGFPVPDGLDDGLAVGLGIAGLAAWLPLAHHAGISGGERVLIVGATSLAGQIAVQAARLLGAEEVVAAGRDAGMLERVRGRGATDAIELGDDPRAQLDEGRFDVVVDYVFGPLFGPAVAAVCDGGLAVVVGPAAGTDAEVRFFDLQGKRVIGHGNPLVSEDVRRDAFATMAAHAAAGRIAFDVERYALDDAPRAWQAQGEGPHQKLVVTP